MAETEKPKPAASSQDAVAPTETERLVRDALSSAQAAVDEAQKEINSASPLEMPDFSPIAAGGSHGIELLSDVDLHVTIELGRTQMLVEDVLKLGEGSVVELDKLAGDPVDIYVNKRLVARGEVLVLNDNFCIRVSEIVANLEEQAHEAAQQEAQEDADASGAKK
ncbi:MAG: flagellar motor switch protein FliN [Phycisphaeraceae bacterium]|nr:flagellar motor switch protein FliN [Phycisphaeraceae bacterium]